MTGTLRKAHGKETIENLLVDDETAATLKHAATNFPSWNLSPRQTCDLELLLNGGFSPLTGFLTKIEYEAVLETSRLPSNVLWPIPITLDVTPEFAEGLSEGDKIALRCEQGVILAILTIENKWTPDKEYEANCVFGTTNPEHPGVFTLLRNTQEVYLGGKLEGLELPKHYDFPSLRLTPTELRKRFADKGVSRVVAFQTRNPMHRAHQELTARAARDINASILLHPVVGQTRPGDIDHFTRVRCYQHLLNHYPEKNVDLALLPLAMRMAGPREALWHAIIRKNYGCTHFIVGRDHAGPSIPSNGVPFYSPYEAHDLLKQHGKELEIEVVPFEEVVYLEDHDKYVLHKEVPEGKQGLKLSGTELRRCLAEGTTVPQWFSYPDVITELRKTHPPRHLQGFTLFFTGLSGSGKSTLAHAIQAKLLEMGGRPVSLLDGDVVRKHLSSELGFSREHRNINVLRIGYVASEVTKNGGIAICAPIAPYDDIRHEVREMIASKGGFILVHVSTSLDECEKRDRKGLYAQARAGKIKEFTGISDPYEEPNDADITIDTTHITPDEGLQIVINYLTENGYLRENYELFN